MGVLPPGSPINTNSPSQRCNLPSCALIFRDVDQQFPMLFGYVTNSKNAFFSLMIGTDPHGSVA